jgi:amino acid adenylation domain-containing protein
MAGRDSELRAALDESLRRRAAEPCGGPGGELIGSDPALVAPVAPDRDHLANLPAAERRPRLVAWLRDQAALALGGPPARLRAEAPLTAQGLDSLSAVELAHRTESAFGVELPLADLLAGASLDELAARLADAIRSPGEAAGQAIPASAPAGPALPAGAPSAPSPASPAAPASWTDNAAGQAGVTPADAAAGREIAPASPGQRALWFIDRLAPGNAAYVLAGAARIRGEIDVAALRDAFARLVERHPALRTTFEDLGGEPRQRIAAAHAGGTAREPAGFTVAELTASGAEELPERLAAIAYQPFDLRQGPLLRITVLRPAPGKGEDGAGDDLVVLAAHHIVTDFWSLGVLLRELGSLYRSPAAWLPPPRLTFAEHVRRTERRLAGPWGERLASYWTRQLAGELPRLALPADRPRPPVQSFRGAARTLAIPGATGTELRALGRTGGATFYMTLLAGFAALLHRHAGQSELLVGSPTSGRAGSGGAELAGLVGYFVNPVALRIDLSGEPSLDTLLERVRATCLDAMAHQELPFPRLVERLRPEREADRSPIFQALFALHQAREDGAGDGLTGFALGAPGIELDLGGLRLESLALRRRGAQFDLSLACGEIGGRLLATLEFSTDLFDAATAGRLLRHFDGLLAAAAAAPARPVGELALLAPAERWQLLAEWNDGSVPWSGGDTAAATLPELLRAQVARTPDALALIAGSCCLTFGELAARAGALAARLRRLGVGPETRVAICAERSPRLVIALLAVLDAGGAYVPLDPAYPKERLEHMLADSGARVLLTERRLLGRIGRRRRAVPPAPPTLAPAPPALAPATPVPPLPPEPPRRRVLIDRLPRVRGAEGLLTGTAVAGRPVPGGLAVHGPRAAPARATAGNLAYVIYTSGSTGRPKGVAIEHRGAVARVRWAAGAFAAAELERVLASTSICFDLSVFELFVPLALGGAAVLADNALALPALPAAHQVTLLNTVPSAAAELVARGALPPSLRTINLAGEPLGRELADDVHRSAHVERLLNLYGPSEDTTYSTCQAVARGEGGPPAIGRPLPGTRLHLLDARLQPVPIGVPGEIFLGGRGLARGYLGRPELTAERFVPDPWPVQSSGGARLYRTGDLAQRLPDGRVRFLGRLDQQVKIRGFRIELGEIEAALRALPGVGDAAVVACAGPAGEPCLAAYVAPARTARRRSARRLDLRRLRERLARRLPAFMVPPVWVTLAALPRTPNGKLDRRALPAPRRQDELASAAGLAPRTPLEELLAGIWADLLQLPRVGVEESFFALGGHSLLAARMAWRAGQALGRELPLALVFAAPTVAALAAAIETSAVPPLAARLARLPERSPQLDAALAAGEAPGFVPSAGRPAPAATAPASFAQERLWLLDQLAPGSAAYNMPAAFRLRGALDEDALRRALRALALRHQALRTTLRAAAGGALVQVVGAAAEPALPVVDLQALARAEAVAARLLRAEAARPFDLGRGPLMRALLLRLPGGGRDHLLLLNFHHAVADGGSLTVLGQELGALYGKAREAAASGTAAPGSARGGSLPELPAPAPQYLEYSVWQRERLGGHVLADALDSWRRQLAGAPAEVELPTDRPRPPVQSLRGAVEPVVLSGELTRALARLAGAAGATRFMILLAALMALLHRYSGQEDLVIGTPVAGRGRPELEGLVGCLVNTLPLRAGLAGDPPWRELLARVRSAALAAYAHQDVPFERLVEELHPERDLSRSPLFQVMLALQDGPAAGLRLPGVGTERVAVHNGGAKFDLTLSLWEAAGAGAQEPATLPAGLASAAVPPGAPGQRAAPAAAGSGLIGELEYSIDLYDRVTVRRLAGHLATLLAAVAAAPDRRLGDLPLLGAAQRAQLLWEWNQPVATAAAAAAPLPLHRLFEAQAARRPLAMAAVHDVDALTYGQLNGRANRLARRLRDLGVGPGSRVGLCVERSLDMIVGLLAILKAGGAYLPLDPTYPEERLAYMLADAGAALVLAQERLGGRLPGLAEGAGAGAGVAGRRVLWLDGEAGDGRDDAGDGRDQAGDETAPDLPGGAGPDDDAYIIYTSGSTGTPKGVEVTHANVARLFTATRDWFDFGPDDVWTLFHSYAFDFSVWEIWGALLAGGRVVVVPYEVSRTPEAFLTLLATRRVTVLNQTPSAFRQLAQVAAAGGAGGSGGPAPELALRWVIFGGEALDPCLLAPWIARYGDDVPRLVNMYGITETTVHVTYARVRAADLAAAGGGSAIGRPIPDLSLHLLDRRLHLLPPGAPGEIHVGGAGVARGYLGRPRLTAERFLPDPWSALPGSRLYRTGDLARRLPDGGLEYLGRIDSQVKIRGFRIELGEIEAALASHPGVAAAVVEARRDPASPGAGGPAVGGPGAGGPAASGAAAGGAAAWAAAAGPAAAGPAEPRLVAWVVAAAQPAPTTSELRAWLARSLPDHMLPAAFHFLAALPLSANGKIDRRALDRLAPEIAAAAPAGAGDGPAPRTPEEEIVAAVWREILGRERIGVETSFFELGGHSLLASRMLARLRQALGVDLPLRLAFLNPTVAALAAEAARRRGAALPPIVALPRPPADDTGAVELPAAFAQERLWYLDALDPGSPAYNIAAAERLRGPLRTGLLRACLAEVVRRHEALRTCFGIAGGRPVQRIAPAATVALPVVDLSALAAAGDTPGGSPSVRGRDAGLCGSGPGGDRAEATARVLAAAFGRRPFVLASGPLLRAALLRLGAADHVLLLVLHHTIADGWSMTVLVRELEALYAAWGGGQPSPLPELPIQYADYTCWQREWLQGGTLDGLLAYWRGQLAGAAELDLPADRPAPAGRGTRGASRPVALPGALADALSALAQARQATPFMVLLAAFQALLARVTGQEDVVVGSPVANRHRAEVLNLVGCFVNTLPLRTELAGDPTVGELLDRVRQVALAAWAHQELPLERLVEELRRQRAAAGNHGESDAGASDGGPLPFRVLLAVQEEPRAAASLHGLALESWPIESSTAKFDLTLSLFSRPQQPAADRPPTRSTTARQAAGTSAPLDAGAQAPGLHGWIEFSTELFDAATVLRLAAHFETLLAGMAGDPARRLSELPLLAPAERHQLVIGWNDTASQWAEAAPDGGCLHRLIEAQLACRPHASAVVYEGAVLSCGELDRRADRLARRLRGLGIGPESRVGVCAERSLELIVGLLAILKAGGAYVPLDPGYPDERLAFMVADSRLGIVLSQRRLGERCERLAKGPVRLVYLDSAAGSPPGSSPDEKGSGPLQGVGAASAAYVIYTSGSTGRPKGVVNSHGGIVNRLLWMQAAYGLAPGDRVLHKTPFSFDVSVWELFWPLLVGVPLVVARPGGHQDAGYLAEAIQREEITTLHFVPSMLQAFLEQPGLERCAVLRRVVASGEALPAELARRFRERLGGSPGAELHNLYGPTEAAVDVTSWRCGDERRPGVPIGRPIANTRIYLLDRQGQPVPVGVAGELHIGGVGLARGYVGRPRLTAEKFVPDPLAAAGGTQPGSRLYRTGDLARFLPGGEIEFLGRIDHQVKIRGFRIELGEIEAALRRHPAVREAVVVTVPAAGGSGQPPRLRACIVPDRRDATPRGLAAELRQALARELPDYMVPVSFLVLGALPVTANGKLDRKALSEPAAGRQPARLAPPREPGRGALEAAAGDAEPAAILVEATAGGLLPEPLPGEDASGGAGRWDVLPRGPIEELVAAVWREVLGLDQLASHHGFFELGGHSLLAAQVIARLRQAFDVEIQLRDLLAAPTVAGLAARIEEARRHAESSPALLATPPLVASPRDRATPLSFAQERLWFLDRLVPGRPIYNLPCFARLRGNLQPAALARSLGEIVARHDVLRTRFPLAGDQPVQEIAPPAAGFRLPRVDLTALRPTAAAAAAARLAGEEARRPFDLTRGPVLRATLLRIAADEHRLLLNLHHIAADAWSLRVLVRELAAFYGAWTGGAAAPGAALPPLALQYADFAVWQRRWLAGEALAAQLAFWRRRLGEDPAPLELPTDRPQPPRRSFAGASLPFRLTGGLTGRLRALARQRQVTPFVLLLAAFQALLHRWSGQPAVQIGAPVANRQRRETEDLIGFFINMLAWRAELSGRMPFTDLLGASWQAALDAYSHQDLPFEKLVEALRAERAIGQSPLFQAVLIYHAAPLPRCDLAGVALEPYTMHSGTAKFDLTLALAEPDGGGAGGSGSARGTGVAEGLAGEWEISTEVFDRVTIARLAVGFERLLGALAERPETALADLPLLGPGERHQLLREWASPPRREAAAATVHELFAARAAAAPDTVALVEDGPRHLHLTYAELAARAGRLAQRLRALGAGPDQPVAVAMERSVELIVALLAILRAGGAYLPLDLAHPAERLQWMLGDLRPRVLLATASSLAALSAVEPGATRVVLLDGAEVSAAAARRPGAWPGSAGPVAAVPDSLAYVMYTSGSSGRPKAVAVPHRAVTRLVRDAEHFRLGPGEVLMQLAPTAFDASTLEIWGALACGGRLVLVPARNPSLSELGAALARQGVTTLWLTAGLFHQVVDAEPAALGGLRQLLAGGDVLSPAHVRRLLAAAPGCTLINGYGPTENTTFTCCQPLRAGAEVGATVPIGRPIPGTRVHVLDAELRPVPPGVAGELCTGGEGLARGYANQPALTAERFVPDPLGDPPGGRLYRTGDRVRHLAGGAIEFLGRLDHQLKVRGFRIEPEEIEAVLAEHPEVEQAAVVAAASPGGDKRLVAWVVPRAPRSPVTAAAAAAPAPAMPLAAPAPTMPLAVTADPALGARLRPFLARRLPEVMIPAAWVPVASLPLSANGKVDRRALAARGAVLAAGSAGAAGAPGAGTPGSPQLASVEGAADAAAAGGWLEEVLAELWADVLSRERVDRDDDFFALGGHSLLATRLVARIEEALGASLPLASLFSHPTVAQLAAEIEASAALAPAAAAASPPPAPPLAPADPAARQQAPLSFAQERLWVLDRLEPGNPAYDVVAGLRLRGELRPEVLRQAFQQVIDRHEILRTTFVATAAGASQRIAPHLPADLPLADLGALPPPAREAQIEAATRGVAATRFDLARGPLLRLLLLRAGSAEHVLLLAAHHIVTDGWSMSVLIREATAAYAACVAAAAPALPELAIQYADFALWQRQWLQGDELARQVAYWRERLRGAPPALELPTDFARPAVRTSRGGRQLQAIAAPLAQELRALARRRGATLFMVLLAAWKVLLQRLSGQDDVVVGAPIAGRRRREVEGLIGMFLNTLVLRTDLAGDPGFGELVERVRRTALEAYAHQDLPFEKLLDELRPERDLSRTPLFQVFFNMLNFPAAELAAPGLAIATLDVPNLSAKFDLTLYVAEKGDGIELELVYNADLFAGERMAELLAQYREVLGQAAAWPDRAIGACGLAAAPLAAAVLPDPLLPLPAEWRGPVHARFAELARRHPDRLAVSDRHESFSYGELDRAADLLARRLSGLGLRRGDVAAIYTHRSARLVAAVLGVIRAGGAFVALDPAHPAGRLVACLRLARPRAWIEIAAAGAPPPELRQFVGELGCGRVQVSLPGAPRLLAGDLAAEQEAGPGEPPGGDLLADDLAYLAFTSGSTGVPKGILGRHGPLSHFIPWQQSEFVLTAADRYSMLSGLSHDPLQRDIFTPLQLGAAISVPDAADIATPGRLAAWMAREAVTIAHLTPAMGQVLVEPAPGSPAATIASLRHSFFVGDVLTRRDVGRLRQIAPAVAVVNLYGSTETQRAVGYYTGAGFAAGGGAAAAAAATGSATAAGTATLAAAAEPAKVARARESLPLGRGVAGVQLLVLNRAGNLAGIGELGEIHLRSPHLARGYLDDPAGTAARFVPHPLAAVAGERLYRTGDLGRYLPDGNVEFAGRADLQVKIRGFRIELGEIEALLARHPAVRDCAVAARDGAAGQKRLVAYVVLAGATPAGDLRTYLKERLPDAMVPAAFVPMERLPVTPNGKLDRRALPEPKPEQRGADAGYVAPRTDSEQAIAAILREVLGVDQVGLHDNFFELGGNSLQLLRAHGRLSEAFPGGLQVVDLFTHPTVAALAAWLARAEESGPPAAAALAPPEELRSGKDRRRLRFAKMQRAMERG